MTLGAAALAVLWRSLVIAALFGALGVGVGAVVCNQAVTVVASARSQAPEAHPQ